MRARSAARGTGSLRIGFYGLLGSGNLGNDASFAVLLDFVRERFPGAVVEVLCPGPDVIRRRHGVAADQLQASIPEPLRRSRAGRVVGVLLTDAVVSWRTVRWVARQDVVLVPGMGVLESTVPMRAWEQPFALFVAATASRLTGGRLALVSVGATGTTDRPTRLLFEGVLRMSGYRSFRDDRSRRSLGRRSDPVFTDLVFGRTRTATTPATTPARGRRSDPRVLTVGLGVMAYSGHRRRDPQVHRDYAETMSRLSAGLLADGHDVVLLVGDADDHEVARAIARDVSSGAGGPGSGRVTVASITSFDELERQMDEVDAVIATRFHNVVCAMRAVRPTIAIGYGPKSRELMVRYDLEENYQDIDELDPTALRRRLDRAVHTWSPRSVERVETALEADRDLVHAQFADLAAWIMHRSRADRSGHATSARSRHGQAVGPSPDGGSPSAPTLRGQLP